jgi:hypothetical protein
MAKKLFVKLQTPSIELKVKATDASSATSEILVGFKRYDLSQLEAKFKEQTPDSTDTNADFNFISKEVIYIKNAVLEIYDEKGEYLEDLVVADTRTVEPNEFFQTPAEALVVLLEHYMGSNPWKNSLFEAYRDALVNVSYKEAELKNL